MPAPGSPPKRSFWEKFFRNMGALPFIAGGMFLIVLNVWLAPTAIVALYPLKKIWNAGRNLLSRHTKKVRSIYRLLGIGGGAYAGGIYGSTIGAAFGSVLIPIPGAGTLAGSVIGGIIGAVLAGTGGALLTKYTAKRISKLVYGDTNPDKWSLTQNQAKKISEKQNAQGKRVSPAVVLQTMDAVAAAKKESQGFFGSTPWTPDHQEKESLNHLLKEIKDGQFTARGEAKDGFPECKVYLVIRDPDTNYFQTTYQSDNKSLYLYENGYSFYYVDYQYTQHVLKDNGTPIYMRNDLGDELQWIKRTFTQKKKEDTGENPMMGNVYPLAADAAEGSDIQKARTYLLERTSRQGGTGSKPPIEMDNAEDDAQLVSLWKSGFFDAKGRATRAATWGQEDRNLTSWTSFTRTPRVC